MAGGCLVRMLDLTTRLIRHWLRAAYTLIHASKTVGTLPPSICKAIIIYFYALRSISASLNHVVDLPSEVTIWLVSGLVEVLP